jgi:hypothetical protein
VIGKEKFDPFKQVSTACIQPTKFLAAVVVLMTMSGLLELSWAGPDWWQEQGLFGVALPDDYAAVNHGQLKHVATKAFEELEAELDGGAGSAITAMVSAWGTPVPGMDDYAPINVGQLKAVAKPFYDRMGLNYPWADSPAEAADHYSVANVGQLKRVFSFDPVCLNQTGIDTDGDGLPDWLEEQIGTSLTVVDTDDDGISDFDEYWGQGEINLVLTNPKY